jgi:4-amino-4-deoxy-L-arabinose transferase-like glycosyltransferase
MRGTLGVRVMLGVILGVGLAARVWGITFGLPHVLARPDELLILGIAASMHTGNPNPGMFDYPGVYLYFVAGLFSIYYGWTLLTGRVAGAAAFQELFRTAWEPFFLIARTVNAVVGAATAGVVHLIGVALFGRVAGLLSALFMALAFLHARNSHYSTSDILMTFFIACAMLAVVRVHQERRARDAWLAGVMGGLATGTKYNAVLVALPMVAVEVLHLWRVRGEWRRAWRDTHLWRMGLAFTLIFVATSPYLFLDYQTALEHLRALQASTAAGMTPPEMLGRGWWYHVPYSLRYGLGLPLLVTGLTGLVVMAVRRPAEALLLGVFPVAYYAVVGAGHNVFVRYMIPVIPFLCLFAGYVVSLLSESAALRLRTNPSVVAAVLGALIVAPSAVSTARFDHLMAQDDSRNLAARWIHEHVPAGRSIFLSGNRYGHPQLEPPVGKYRLMSYDYRGRAFLTDTAMAGGRRYRHTDEHPDVIVVQRSAIPYSHIPEEVESMLGREYTLVHQIRAADLTQPNFYDIQDGFYAPFGGFAGVTRPGPNIEIYEKR